MQPAAKSPYLTEIVNKYAPKGELLAHHILHNQTAEVSASVPETPIIVIREYSPWWGRMWMPMYYQPMPIYVGRPQSREERREDMFATVAAIASITFGFAFYYAAKAARRLVDADYQCSVAQNFRRHIDQVQAEPDSEDDQILIKARTVANIHAKIATDTWNSALTDLALRITASVGCALLAVGCIFGYIGSLTCAIQPLIISGLVAATISGMAILFKNGFESNRIIIHDAHRLQVALQQLRTSL